LSDYELKSLVSSFNRLKPFVDASGKERRDILLELADKEKTDVI
jgi:hypothetical protein